VLSSLVVGCWLEVKDGNTAARTIFGRHYTYRPVRNQISLFPSKNRNFALFVGPGEKVVLITPDERAIFAWRKFRSMDPEQTGVNCSVFRNEGSTVARSSDLIRAADLIAWERWPGERLYTYVDPKRTRHKRDPGRCFLRAGWRHYGWSKSGLRILEILPEWA